MKKTLLLLFIMLCTAALNTISYSGMTAMAQTRPGGKRLTPAQQRIVQYNKQKVEKTGSVQSAKMQRAQSTRSGMRARLMSMDDQKERYNELRESLDECRIYIWDPVRLVESFDDTNGLVGEMMPFFEADPTLPSAVKGLKLQKQFKDSWNELDEMLETNYAAGTLTDDLSYEIEDRIWTEVDMTTVLDAFRGMGDEPDLFNSYQREYANKYFNGVVTNLRKNCSFGLYQDNLVGKRVSPNNPSCVTLGLYDKEFNYEEHDLKSANVAGYYMIPTSDASRNPKSWYVLGYNYDLENAFVRPDLWNPTNEPQTPDEMSLDGIELGEPTDESTEGLFNKWIVLSHITDADLDKMEKDDKGRVLFPVNKLGKFTHVLLYVTDVVGGEGNPSNEMQMRGFYTSADKDFSFGIVKKKTTFDLQEWPRKARFAVVGLDNPNLEIVDNKINLLIRNSDSVHEIQTTAQFDANGEMEFDFTPYHSTFEANKQFPLQIGKMATFYFSCKLRNKADNTETDFRQSVPVYVEVGKPNTYLEPLVFDGSKSGEKAEYTFTIENIDPNSGAFLHMVVEDYASGKLAPNTIEYALMSGDLNLDDIDKNYDGVNEVTSWLTITRGTGEWKDVESQEWEKIAARLTATATITLPVSCIPFGTASVTAGAANLTEDDPYGQLAYDNVFMENVTNTSFDVNQIKGTWYIYGSKETRSIDDWDDNDNGMGSAATASIIENINAPVAVDAILEQERNRFTRIMNFECPVAWGDVTAILTSDGQKIGGMLSHENRFTLTVDFPNNGKNSILELSWLDGKITRQFSFTGSGAQTISHLYSYTPIVHGDDNDQLHTVIIYNVNKGKDDVREGHFSENTAYDDNKVYVWRENTDQVHFLPSCVLQHNGFIGKSSYAFEEDGHSYERSQESVAIWQNPGVRFGTCEPRSTLINRSPAFELRYDAAYATFAIVNEVGEPIKNAEIRYVYTKEQVSQPGKMMGFNADDPMFVKPAEDSKIMHREDSNIYSVPLLTSSDPNEFYNLMIEVNATSTITTPFNTQLFCEAVNGAEFRRCIESGDIFTCVMREKNYRSHNSGAGRDYIQDIYVRNADQNAFDDEIRHFDTKTIKSFEYVGDGSSCIDLLVRSVAGARDKVEMYVLAPLDPTVTGLVSTPLEGYLKEMETASDQQGNPIEWLNGFTGFKYDYQLMTTNTQWLLPDLVAGQEQPEGYTIVLWEGTKVMQNGQPHTIVKIKDNGYYASCAWALRGYNFQRDRSAEIAGDAVNCLDLKGEDMSLGEKKSSLGFLSTFLDGFCNLNLSGPESLPFSMSLTHEDDHFKLRGQFEFNALDLVPGYAAYQQAQKFGDMTASEFQKQYMRTKREFISQRSLKAMKVAQGLNAFVGFKGFFDASLYHSDDFCSWTPYFNDLAVRLEASVSASAPKMPLKFCDVGMSLQAAMYAQLMIANPSDKDPLLDGRNPLSHFNIYYTMGAGIDMAAWASVGVDLGFISAMAGIRGTAGASMEFTTMSRPWLDSGLQSGMRFNVNASLYAYAKARFLFWEASYDKKFFDVDKTVYFPDDDRPIGGNPYIFDPNLADGIDLGDAKACVIRPTFTNYAKRASAPAMRAQQVLNGIDAYSSPTYFGNSGKIAYFSLNNPKDVMDDRIVINDGGSVTPADEDDCTALSFSTATAPGTNKSVMAIQRLKKNTASVDAMDMSDQNKQDVGTSTEIQIITNGLTWDDSYTVSNSGVTNMNPAAAIDAKGNYAVVWPAGEMKFQQTENGSEPYIEGDLMMYSCGAYNTYQPVSLALLDEKTKVNDYAVGFSNGMPFVWATIPQTDKNGKTEPCVYGIVNQYGIVNTMSLGIKGSNHQIIQLADGRFIAASKEVTDEAGVDVSLYEGSVEDGRINIRKLGSLGLNKYNVTNYKLFASRNGAQSADDLYVVWNQHDIEVTDQQTLAATSANNCFVAQVSTLNGLGVSYPTKLCSLLDEESLVNIDAYASDGNEVTALLCVSGAGNDASTGAYVLQIDSKIDNAVSAVGADLENVITKGVAPSVKLTVRNEGHDPITSLEAVIGKTTATAPVYIKPGEDGFVSVKLPVGADLTQSMDYTVKATFTNEATSHSEQRDCSDGFSLEVADIAAQLLFNQIDDEANKSVVTALVKNLTAGRLRSGYTVKAGLYLDANGHNLYPGTEVRELTAADFRQSGTNSIPVTFLVPAAKEETMAYIIVQTVADDGMVVIDQVKGNNIVPLNLEPTASEGGTPTHLITAEDFEKPLLTVRNDGDAIIVSDIDTDNDVKVYGTGGNLIHWTKAGPATVRIPNVPHGVILISNGTRAGKILH